MTNGYKRHGGKNSYGGKKPGGPKGLPDGYLMEGYFSSDGHIREELLTTTADRVAKCFGQGYPKLTNGQLRRFYGHIKTAEKSYQYTGDEEKLVLDIKALASFVAEAQGKKKVPKDFYTFIKKNTEMVKSDKDAKKGFVPHFQAVVGYFYMHYPNN